MFLPSTKKKPDSGLSKPEIKFAKVDLSDPLIPLMQTISPLLLIIALIPLFADLAKYKLFSTDLKIALAKCWWGPIDFPNQPSSEIFIIKLVLSSVFCYRY